MNKLHTALSFLAEMVLILGGAAMLKWAGLPLRLADGSTALAAGRTAGGSDALNTAAGYSIDWFTVDSGGGQSGGGGYQLSMTLGQPDAGASSGGSYSLLGGFWPGILQPWQMFLPRVRR